MSCWSPHIFVGRYAGLVTKPTAASRGSKSTKARPLADPFALKIEVMSDALGSKSKAAEYLGVSRGQPGKWLSGAERPNPRARRRIRDFEYVWGRITDDRTPAAAQIWLDSANAFLNGATPLSWLRTRGPRDVIAALDAEEAGSYA